MQLIISNGPIELWCGSNFKLNSVLRAETFLRWTSVTRGRKTDACDVSRAPRSWGHKVPKGFRRIVVFFPCLFDRSLIQDINVLRNTIPSQRPTMVAPGVPRLCCERASIPPLPLPSPFALAFGFWLGAVVGSEAFEAQIYLVKSRRPAIVSDAGPNGWCTIRKTPSSAKER